MITALIFLPLSTDGADMMHTKIRDSSKFSAVAEIRKAHWSFKASRLADGFEVSGYAYPHEGGKEEMAADARVAWKHESPSGYPLGVKSGHHRSPGSVMYYVSVAGALCRTRILSNFEPDIRPGNRFPIRRQIDMVGELPFAEEVARYAVSAYKGSKTVPSENVSFGQATLVGRKSGETQTRYVRLASVASAAGWSLGVGTHGMTGQATRSGLQAMVFVAGANAYKRGAEWVPLPDTTVLVDGELWVPTGVLAGF